MENRFANEREEVPPTTIIRDESRLNELENIIINPSSESGDNSNRVALNNNEPIIENNLFLIDEDVSESSSTSIIFNTDTIFEGLPTSSIRRTIGRDNRYDFRNLFNLSSDIDNRIEEITNGSETMSRFRQLNPFIRPPFVPRLSFFERFLSRNECNDADSNSSASNLRYGKLVVEVFKKLNKKKLMKTSTVDSLTIKRIYGTYFKLVESDKKNLNRCFKLTKKFINCLTRLSKLQKIIEKMDFSINKNYNDVFFIKLLIDIYHSYFLEFGTPKTSFEKNLLYKLAIDYNEKLSVDNLNFIQEKLDSFYFSPYNFRLKRFKNKEESLEYFKVEQQRLFNLDYGIDDKFFYIQDIEVKNEEKEDIKLRIENSSVRTKNEN